MVININQIPDGGLAFEETIPAQEVDIDTDVISLSCPVKVKAEIFKITNAVSIDLNLETRISFLCSRCLSCCDEKLNKNLQLNYSLEKFEFRIDLGPDIRQELLIEFPVNPLCRPECKGLCRSCGHNLNESVCNCNEIIS